MGSINEDVIQGYLLWLNMRYKEICIRCMHQKKDMHKVIFGNLFLKKNVNHFLELGCLLVSFSLWDIHRKPMQLLENSSY